MTTIYLRQIRLGKVPVSEGTFPLEFWYVTSPENRTWIYGSTIKPRAITVKQALDTWATTNGYIFQ